MVGGRQVVDGVGEGGHPLAVPLDGVPADVVGVQMGVDHHVDVLGPHTGGREQVEEVAVPLVEEAVVRALPTVPDAGVDQDGAAPVADHPALQGAEMGVVGAVPVVGREQVRVPLPVLGRRPGHDVGGGHERPLPLPDPQYLGLAEHDPFHGPSRGGA